MTAVSKTLLIDRPAGEMTVFVNGDATQRVPIRRTRTLTHLGAIYKKLGYTVIDKKGRKETKPVASPNEVKRSLFNALIEIEKDPSVKLNVKTDGALRHRGYITGTNQITPAGIRFMHQYSVKNGTPAPVVGTVRELPAIISPSPLEGEGDTGGEGFSITGSDDSHVLAQIAPRRSRSLYRHRRRPAGNHAGRRPAHHPRQFARHGRSHLPRPRPGSPSAHFQFSSRRYHPERRQIIMVAAVQLPPRVTPIDVLLKLHNIQITPEQEAKQQRIQALYNDFVERAKAYEQTLKAKDEFENNTPCPSFPKHIADLREIFIVNTLIKRWQAEKGKIESDVRTANHHFTFAMRDLARAIPNQCWIRFGDTGVYAYGENMIKVQPWAEIEAE